MSTLEITLGILLTTSVICLVWLVLGGRFIIRRLERRIRELQGKLLTAEHLAHLWNKKAGELSGALNELQPARPMAPLPITLATPRRTRPKPPASWPAQRNLSPSRAYDAVPREIIPPSDKKVIL